MIGRMNKQMNDWWIDDWTNEQKISWLIDGVNNWQNEFLLLLSFPTLTSPSPLHTQIRLTSCQVSKWLHCQKSEKREGKGREKPKLGREGERRSDSERFVLLVPEESDIPFGGSAIGGRDWEKQGNFYSARKREKWKSWLTGRENIFTPLETRNLKFFFIVSVSTILSTHSSSTSFLTLLSLKPKLLPVFIIIFVLFIHLVCLFSFISCCFSLCLTFDFPLS